MRWKHEARGHILMSHELQKAQFVMHALAIYLACGPVQIKASIANLDIRLGTVILGPRSGPPHSSELYLMRNLYLLDGTLKLVIL
jgi:hypothetical protein